MNRVLSVLLLVLVLTAGGIVALVNREKSELARQLDQSRASVAKLEDEVKSLRAERDQLQKQIQKQSLAMLDAAVVPASKPTRPSPPASGDPAAPGTAAANPPPPGGKPGNPFAQMLKDPKMKEMMKQQQRAALDLQYAPLIAKFRFNDGEKSDFKQLLSERAQAEMEMGVKMLEDLTPEQRKAAVAEYNAARKSSDDRIRDFLNSDTDYSTFKDWEETRGERMALEMSRGLFSGNGEALTSDQEQQLISTMHRVNQQTGTSANLQKPENFDPQKFTPAEIEKQLADYDTRAQQVAEQAAQFLSPKQVETLRTMQQQWRSMTEGGLRMTASMFGVSDAPGK